MEYSIEKIKEQFEKEESLKFLFFRDHKASKDNSITKTCFSQWWSASFVKEQLVYKTAEHFMMAEKARLFNDF